MLLWFMSKSKVLNSYLLQINFSHFITNEKLCCCCYCLDLPSYPNKKYKLFIWTNFSVKSQSHDSIFSEPNFFFLKQFFFQFVKFSQFKLPPQFICHVFFSVKSHYSHNSFWCFWWVEFYIKNLFFLFYSSNNSNLGVAWIFSRIFWLNQHFALACCCYTILCATLH